MRWLAVALAASSVACLYENDWVAEHDPASDYVNCTGHWDCLEDNQICGSIVSEKHDGGPCGDQEGWIGLDDYDVKVGESFDDQDSIHFVCIDDTRYFPYCTFPGDRECDGKSCPEGVCAARLDDPDKAVCVGLGNLSDDCSSDVSVCPTSHPVCVRFLEWGQEGAATPSLRCAAEADID